MQNTAESQRLSSMFTDERSGAGCIEQFVQNVDDFSSQYGSEISVSYTAFNIRGPPSNFPDYGDYPQAFVMRTYGRWWQEAPSSQEDYMPHGSDSVTSQDFVEVSFKQEVYPTEVSVFETYNPGALVRIWAKGPSSWLLLWQGEPEHIGDTPRIFCPPIRQINVPSRKLRLEFNHELLPYYTELDAVLLKGTEVLYDSIKKDVICYSMFNKKHCPVVEKGQILSYVLASNLQAHAVPPAAHAVKFDDTGPRVTRDTRDMRDMRDTRDTEQRSLALGDFEVLPDETILAVLRHLDIRSLSRCARVCRHLRALATDAILYRCIDLRPYWNCVRAQTIQTFTKRCSLLQKLDLSWCGSHGMLDSACLVAFLKECGAGLTHLRLNCCKFVDVAVFRQITHTCTKLEELCLRSLSASNLDWSCLKLTKLKRLDLYRSEIPTQAAVELIYANPGLLHLNVGSCNSISSMDDVASALGYFCPGLVSVDFWKSYSLTAAGLRQLARCTQLQELDVGWCLQAGNSGEWLREFRGSALRKLFLGAMRGVTDEDLRQLLPRLRRLQQLDLLGVRAVTPAICEAILEECHDLRLLDVSFCDKITYAKVQDWTDRYPYVSVKKSFQSSNIHAPNPLFWTPSLE